jgi:opacity protein-like surface antigen
MKNIKLSLITLMAVGTLAHAGGDFSPITYYETEDATIAEEVYVEPVYVEPEIVEEVYTAPDPIVVETAVVIPPKVVVAPIPVKNIRPNGFYAGIGIVATQYQTTCCASCLGGGIDKTAGVMARIGYDFNQYIGLEARGIRTNWKADGGKVKHGGIFLKPMVPLGESTNIYGLVGLAKTKTEGHLQTTNAEALALGAGVEVDLSEDRAKEGRYGRTFDGHGDQEKGIGLFLDYERMVVKSGAPDLDAVSAGVTYDF